MLTASLVLDLATPPPDSFGESDRHKVYRAGLGAAPMGRAWSCWWARVAGPLTCRRR
jgi:hypothetical protein